MGKKILFISWDGPQTNYMEGLFMPIFNEIKKNYEAEFHVIQFTWATTKKIELTKKSAIQMGIIFESFPIYRKPIIALGNLVTLCEGIRFLKHYIRKNHIDVVMPRSIMPAIMVNRINGLKFKICFDADGLPIEERVDFSGLMTTSCLYRFLKREEKKILIDANHVITRSQLAIEHHLKSIGEIYRNKFSVVFNGRSKALYNYDAEKRINKRKELALGKEERTFIYCGSLGGGKYAFQEMLLLFEEYLKVNSFSKFIILTGSLEYANSVISERIKSKTIVRNVPVEEVPMFLNAADVALALIAPKYSLKGAAAIKLGEYLLTGLPVIASKGIGDSELILEQTPNCFIYDHEDGERINKTIKFLKEPFPEKKEEIRKIGTKYFSIEKSVQSYINALKHLS